MRQVSIEYEGGLCRPPICAAFDVFVEVADGLEQKKRLLHAQMRRCFVRDENGLIIMRA
jgi:hypothetical protein